MKTIAFNLENLSFRGTVTALKDYAQYNMDLLNNKSIICYQKDIKNITPDQNFIKSNEVFEYFNDRYDMVEYTDMSDLDIKLKKHNTDYAYFLKAGFDDGIMTKDIKSLIHCVFNNYQPHGYRYAYVSKWLAQAASENTRDYVPHIVNLPMSYTVDYRKKLGIGFDKVVVGRYGGFDQFDIEMVMNTVGFIVHSDPSFVFVFVNTRKFIDHPNVIFIEEPILDPQEKSNYILSCNAMLHARSDGESFGLSICEFLFHNVPVISYGGGRDKNNVELLSEYGMIYHTQYELIEQLIKLKYRLFDCYYAGIVEQFSPEDVMERFDKVFLN